MDYIILNAVHSQDREFKNFLKIQLKLNFKKEKLKKRDSAIQFELFYYVLKNYVVINFLLEK